MISHWDTFVYGFVFCLGWTTGQAIWSFSWTALAVGLKVIERAIK